jgi:hypothetical protein
MDLTAEQKDAWLARVRDQCETAVRHVERNGGFVIVRSAAPMTDPSKRICGGMYRTEDISKLSVDVDEPLTPANLLNAPYGDNSPNFSYISRLHTWVATRIEMAASKRWGGSAIIVWHPPTITLTGAVDMEDEEAFKYKIHQIHIELNMEFIE